LNEEGYGANLRLIKKALETVDRSKVQIMVKVGMDTRAPVDKTGSQWIIRGDDEGLRTDVAYALEQLGVDCIDIVVLCRVSPTTPIEESVATFKALVDEGKVKHIALSEASAANIRRAAAVAPIYAIEQEWSLWTRDLEEEILPVCKELGIKIVAYSPLGRGFLTGNIRSRDDPEVFDAYDYRLIGQPRYAEENLATNLALVDATKAIADRKGATVGQMALAWLEYQATFHGVEVISIPGTTSIKHLDENLDAANISLSPEDVDEINAVFQPGSAAGDRYGHMAMTYHGNK
jgi:aryl-alcohol dehydrogenase-like predicted oxidoreductase